MRQLVRPVDQRWWLLTALALAACNGTVMTSGGDGGSDAARAMLDGGGDGGVFSADMSGDASILGPVCATAGTFCGGHNVSGGDPGTLYLCARPDSSPGSWMACANGCEVQTGAPDDCKPAPMMQNGPVCTGPSGGYYCGGDAVTNGDPNTLYHCPGPNMAPDASMACANGCQVEPQGTNDLCKAGIICPSVTGDYCGGDMLGGDPSTLYHCTTAGQPPASSMTCASGCAVMPQGTNDVCRSSLSCPGTGAYCGSDGVQGGAADTLYQCPGAGQAPSSATPCASGCNVQPAGTPDYCNATLACPTAGDYCGNDGVGGSANVLYHCSAGGQPPTSSTTCSGGCVVMAAGTPDVCAGSCPALGQTALNWEANQLNTGHSWSDLCLGFVNNAFINAGQTLPYLQYYDANDSLNAARATGRFVNWNGGCPCGAILYWSANRCNGEYGHIVICNGDGTVSTSGWPGFGGSTHASISWMDSEECGNTPAGYIVPP